MSQPAPALIDQHGRALASHPAANHRAGDRFSQEMARFNPWLSSADAGYLAERDTIAARAHYIADNNGWASGMLQRYVDQVIGANYRLSARPDWKALGLDVEWAREWSAAVEARWRTYANDPRCYMDAGERLNAAGLFGLAFRHSLLDGEALAVSEWLERPNFDWATALHVIDPDRLSNASGMPDTDVLRGGVAINRFGAPQAYHIRNAHPGDVFAVGPNRYAWTIVERRTPWGRARVLHHFEPARAGSTRGKSLLAPVIEKLKMLDHYERVEMQAALTNAIFAAFVESPFDHEMMESALQTGAGAYQDQRIKFHGESSITLDGMRLPILYPGEEVKFQTAARPNTGFADFEKACLRYIAASVGQSYEQLAQDWSSTNYSSARAALLESWKFLTARSGHFAAGFSIQVYGLWLEEEMEKDVLPMPSKAPAYWDNPAAWTRCKFRGPARGWVDPVKEAQAAKFRIDAGLSTLQDEADEQGRDWEETLEQQAFEDKRRADLGLPPPGVVEVGADPDEGDARDARENREAGR